MARAALASIARTIQLGGLAASVAVAHVPAARGQIVVPTDFIDEVVVDGLDKPVAMAFVPDGRCFVTEQFAGTIRLVVNDAFAALDPVLAVDSVDASEGERGLLGIAVDPGFPAQPYLYAQYTLPAGLGIRISRFTVDGDLAWANDGQLTLDPASRRDVLLTPDAAGHHNGGTLRFGPDRMLYSSLGDDGINCHAQDLTILRGKIVRLDVSSLGPGPGGLPPLAAITPADNPFVTHPHTSARLVWAYGLRNPARFHIDHSTGALWIGDVGEETYEEVDWAPTGGMNFGWPYWEGALRRDDTCPGADTSAFVAPVAYYGRCEEGCELGLSVIAGPVYRRPPGATMAFPPEYEGDAFFTDYYRGFLRRMTWDGVSWTVATPVPGQPAPNNWGDPYGLICDFAVSPDGRLYYVQQFMPCCPPQSGVVGRVSYVGTLAVAPAAEAGFVFTAWPVPAHAGLALSFRLERPSVVELAIHDLGGRLVRRVLHGARLASGVHRVEWDARDSENRRMGPGLYVARLMVDGRAVAKRVPLAY